MSRPRGFTTGPNGFARIDKSPQAIKDYEIDYSAWLGDDTIVSSTWVIPEGLTQRSETFDPTTTMTWISGGELHILYKLVNTIVTVGGRTETTTFEINVMEI